MFYFGWLALDYRSRYLGLLRERMAPGGSWLDDPVYGTYSRVPTPDRSSCREEEADIKSPEDPAWQDLGGGTRESLGDWLDGNGNSQAGRHGKKSC